MSLGSTIIGTSIYPGDASCAYLERCQDAAPFWQEAWDELCSALQSLSVEHAGVEQTAVERAAATAVADSQMAVDLADIGNSLRGDDQAYARLVRRYQAQITSQVWRASRRRDDCEDLVQEVFVEAYVSLAKYQARSPFLHWLRKITTRVCYRYWKRQARLRRQSSLSDSQWHQIAFEGAPAASAENAADVVHDLLSKLSPRNRLVMTLIFLEECTVAEAAELTGWSRTMVKVQSFRARQKLKALLNEAPT